MASVTLPGKRELPLVIDKASAQTKDVGIVLMHGASGDHTSGHLPDTAQAFAADGFTTIRYALTTSLKKRAEACRAVVEYGNEQLGIKRWVLAGHSMVRCSLPCQCESLSLTVADILLCKMICRMSRACLLLAGQVCLYCSMQFISQQRRRLPVASRGRAWLWRLQPLIQPSWHASSSATHCIRLARRSAPPLAHTILQTELLHVCLILEALGAVAPAARALLTALPLRRRRSCGTRRSAA